MKFDRKSPGGGLEIETFLENGKASFQCTLQLQSTQEDRDSYLDLMIWNRENQLVFRACHFLWQEEPIKGMMLHPHLWQGTEDAYLYRVQAMLRQGDGTVSDKLEKKLAFRNLAQIPYKGWTLNEKPIEIRAVSYEMPLTTSAGEKTGKKLWEDRLRQDLQLIREMGANGICLKEQTENDFLQEICDEMGLLVWPQGNENMPYFHQLRKDGFLTDCYYYHKACWSKEAFVYISRESMIYEKEGTLQVTVYSNQPKVALYVGGELFEFRTEGPEFVFQGIPIKQLPLLLTAETRECSMSLWDYPIHKKFTI